MTQSKVSQLVDLAILKRKACQGAIVGAQAQLVQKQTELRDLLSQQTSEPEDDAWVLLALLNGQDILVAKRVVTLRAEIRACVRTIEDIEDELKRAIVAQDTLSRALNS